MRARFNKEKNEESALTLIDLLIILAVIAMAAAVLLPALSKARSGPGPIRCGSNLKQISLAFLVYAGDNNNRYPMETLTNKLGVALYRSSMEAFRYFQVMSNELCDPSILVCPDDKSRRAATNFSTDFNSDHISYFVGLDGHQLLSNSFLVGDTHITNGTLPKSGLLEITSRQPAGWTTERHKALGNLATANGWVQLLTTAELQSAIQKTGLATNLLLMPDKNSVK